MAGNLYPATTPVRSMASIRQCCMPKIISARYVHVQTNEGGVRTRRPRAAVQTRQNGGQIPTPRLPC